MRRKIDGIKYECDDKTMEATVIELNNQKKVRIPSHIETDGKQYTVTEISVENSFNPWLKELYIPNTIKKIKNRSFYKTSLEKLEFEGNSQLEYIENECFVESQLTNIEIPRSVKKIGNWFLLDSELESVSFEENSSLEIIGCCAFNGHRCHIVYPSIVKEIWGSQTNVSCDIEQLKMSFGTTASCTIKGDILRLLIGVLEKGEYVDANDRTHIKTRKGIISLEFVIDDDKIYISMECENQLQNVIFKYDINNIDVLKGALYMVMNFYNNGLPHLLSEVLHTLSHYEPYVRYIKNGEKD